MTQVVPKRKVRARVRLANSRGLDGFLYAAVAGARGEPETLADRLNDSTEKYLPFALEDRHVLLNKSCIVALEVPRSELPEPGEAQAEDREVTEFRLRFDLSDGTSISGVVAAEMPFDRERPLDFLNLRAARFLGVKAGDGAILINGDFVVSVTEVHASDVDAARWAPIDRGYHAGPGISDARVRKTPDHDDA